jgi:hypothetical protein
LVVESKGAFVDLNVRNGRRLLNFGTGSESAKKRARPTRSKEASMEKLQDLHPDAMWCGNEIVSNIVNSKLKVEATGMDLKSIAPQTIDPEELLLGIEEWNIAKEPPPEHTWDLYNFVDLESKKARDDAKAAKKAEKALEKEKKKEAKQLEKEKNKALKAAAKEEANQERAKPPPTKKRKSQKKPPPEEFEGFPNYYPPVGHVVEFNWGGGWCEAEFLKMELDADADGICCLLDAKTGETHQIMSRENDLDDVWQDCLD